MIMSVWDRNRSVNEESHAYRVSALAERHGVYFMQRDEMYVIRNFLYKPQIEYAVYSKKYQDLVEYQAMMFHKIREITRWSCTLNGMINMFPVTCIGHDDGKLDLPGIFFIEGNNFYCHEKAPDEVKMALTVIEELLPRRPIMETERYPKLLINFFDSHYGFGGLPEETWPRTFKQVMAKYQSLDDEETKEWVARLKYEKNLEALFNQHGLTSKKAVKALNDLLLKKEVPVEEIHEIIADLLI